MKLNYITRPAEKKSQVKQARREGKIPAALYVRGKNSEPILVDEAEFSAILRDIKKGRLSTTKITLVDDKGNEKLAIVKDIQYHVTTYKVLHLDMEELIEDVKVNVNVPIIFRGVADCVGIKLGGILRQVIRSLRVQCLPKDLPEIFELDISSLNIKEMKRLNELDIPDSVRPLADVNEVCVVIAKR